MRLAVQTALLLSLLTVTAAAARPFTPRAPFDAAPIAPCPPRLLLRCDAAPPGSFLSAAPFRERGVHPVGRPDSLPPPDPWLGFDKVQHVTFSFLWTVSSQYALVDKLGVRERRALPVALASGAAVGLLKEVYDYRRGPSRFFSRRDLAADAVGLVFATVFILL